MPRKELTEKAGIDAKFMTYEQLLILIISECGEYQIYDFLKDRYDIPQLQSDFEKRELP